MNKKTQLKKNHFFSEIIKLVNFFFISSDFIISKKKIIFYLPLHTPSY
jgi:hypothetical protein